MEHKAANTAWGAIFQAALEQLIPKEQRVIHDPTIFHLMPAYLRGLVNLCRIDFIRRTLLNLMERKVPGIRGGVLCRKRYIEGKQMYGLEALYRLTRVDKQLWLFGWEPEAIADFLGEYSWKELEQVGSAEYQQRFLAPVNRTLAVMEVERAVHAVK